MHPDGPPRPGRKLTAGWQRLVALLYVVGFGSFVYWWIKHSSRASLIGWGVVVLVIAALVVIRIRFPRSQQVMARVSAAYVRFVVWWLLFVGPAALALVLFRLLVERAPTPLQAAGLILAAGLLALALYAIATELRREQLFENLSRHVGALAPLAYAFNLLIFAILFFASLTHQLQPLGPAGWLEFTPPEPESRASGPAASEAAPAPAVEPTFEQLTDFYLWHFLEAIPVFDVTETLRLSPPFNYNSSLVGLLLLAFKVTVIFPVIAVFVLYAKRRNSAFADAEQGATAVDG